MTASTSRLTRGFGAAAAILLIAGSLGACSSKSDSSESGGSSGTQGTTSTDEGGAANAPAAGADASYEDWMAKYNNCLVDAGVPPVVMEADGSVKVDMGGDDVEQGIAAAKACNEKLGPPPANDTTGQTPATEAEILQSVECLRQRGYEVADPQNGVLGLPQNITEEDKAACFPTQ